jgi:predicted sulfurtransferase
MAEMTATQTAPRISARELQERLGAAEPVTVLDVRGQQAWDGSNEKVRGAIRVAPERFRAEPSWPKDRLKVAY